MPWGIAAAAVVGAYSANQQSKAAKGAANAQANAAGQANDTQRYMYDQSRQDQMPWLTTGASALNKLGQLYGLNTMAPAANQSGTPASGSGGVGTAGYETGTPVNLSGQGAPQNALTGGGGQPDYSAFYDSPDYQFALQQGVSTLDRSAAARGRLYSGGYGQDLTRFGQGLASQQLGNYTNRLASIAGVGQTAGNNLSALGANYANQYGQNLNNAADARSSAYAANANANTGYANQLGQAFGSWYGGYKTQGGGSTGSQYNRLGGNGAGDGGYGMMLGNY